MVLIHGFHADMRLCAPEPSIFIVTQRTFFLFSHARSKYVKNEFPVWLESPVYFLQQKAPFRDGQDCIIAVYQGNHIELLCIVDCQVVLEMYSMLLLFKAACLFAYSIERLEKSTPVTAYPPPLNRSAYIPGPQPKSSKNLYLDGGAIAAIQRTDSSTN